MSSVALGRPSTALPRVLLKRPGARTRTFFASAPWGKQRLVILGSGWGGYEVLRAVDKKRWSKFFAYLRYSYLAGNWPVLHIATLVHTAGCSLALVVQPILTYRFVTADVIIVSPNNYFNFTPLLASCAVGTLEFRAAIEPVSTLSSFPGLIPDLG